MPPKVSKKTEQKAKAKVIEDKTFGLKNKNKSKAVQKYIQAVTANVQNAGTKQAKAEVRVFVCYRHRYLINRAGEKTPGAKCC